MSEIETTPGNTEITLEDIILGRAALIARMVADIGLSEETAYDLYKFEISMFYTYGQRGTTVGEEYSNDSDPDA